jgi:pentatricopeptide repeat protein
MRRRSCCARQGYSEPSSGAREPPPLTQLTTLVCLAVRRGRRDEAFSLLREAMQHGLSPAQTLGIETDPDLKAFHEDARFAAIIARAKQHAAAAQKAN